MKLLRYGAVGAEKPGAIDANGLIRDLSLLVPDFTPDWLVPAKLSALSANPHSHWRTAPIRKP